MNLSASVSFSPFSLQLELGQRTVTVTIPPFVLVLMGLAASGGYAAATLHSRAQAQELAILRESQSQLEKTLQDERAEKIRINALAEARSKQLAADLEKTQKDLTGLWTMLSQQDAQVAKTRERHSLSSRRGLRAELSKLGRSGTFQQRETLSGTYPAASNLAVRFSNLQVEVSEQAREVETLQSAALEARQRRIAALEALKVSCTPSGAPCAGEMTSPFGNRVHPIYGVGRPHNGCDFTTDYGTKIVSTAAGKVVHSDWLGGYGKVIEIDHGFGLHTLFAHCDELKVKKGDKVLRGQLIATVGMTGLTSGPHCHYEVHRDGKPIDPQYFLADQGFTGPMAHSAVVGAAQSSSN